MIEFNDATISKLIFHRISIDDEKSFISDVLLDIKTQDDQTIFKKIFLKSFLSTTTTYQFNHGIDLELNTLLKLCKSIYDGKDFLQKSKSIHKHLKSVSKHPNIKDGDLFIVKFDEIKMNNKFYEGLGIYKIENKESFIETYENKGNLGIKVKQGISSKKLDKACLVLFTEEPYTILVIDNNSIETDYWQNEFLKVGFRNDNVNSTNQFLSITKSFVTEQLPTEFEITKADQIDLLNRSVNYFKTHENFDKDEFENDVLQDKGIIKSFRSFDSNYREEKEIESVENFEISPQAVKKQEKVFKSVLKLDKNFHIYIHGDSELIQQGIEKDGRKYYKIYYKDES